MKIPTAILAGFSLVAVAIYVGGDHPALSQAGDSASGPWTFKGQKPENVVWLLNSKNGAMHACFARPTERRASCVEIE